MLPQGGIQATNLMLLNVEFGRDEQNEILVAGKGWLQSTQNIRVYKLTACSIAGDTTEQ